MADVKPTPDERAARGRKGRERSPRTGLGKWEPAAGREDPVTILERQAETRVPELVPLRYARMLTSAFAFYRGAAAIMAADLASTPDSGIRAQLCGDAHLSNFGGFSAPDREIVFDVNDFDETYHGPWEWDLERLVASVEIAGRDREFSRRERRDAVAAAAAGYRTHMRELAELGNLELWYQRLNVSEFAELATQPGAAGEIERLLRKARGKDRMRALGKLTRQTDEGLRFNSNPPLLTPVEEIFDAEVIGDAVTAIKTMIDTYRRSLGSDSRYLFDSYDYVHLARKVVGVGSVGTRAWLVLYLGRDETDPLFLQVKEAQPSVLAEHVGGVGVKHQGHRVVRGQRLMQAAGDFLLGWMTADSPDGVRRNFYVRQYWDQKLSPEIERFSPGMLAGYAGLCGQTLARAHARTGDRIAIASYLGAGDNFDRAMVKFAAVYADQNERDFEAVSEAASSGRIEVAADPQM